MNCYRMYYAMIRWNEPDQYSIFKWDENETIDIGINTFRINKFCKRL